MGIVEIVKELLGKVVAGAGTLAINAFASAALAQYVMTPDASMSLVVLAGSYGVWAKVIVPRVEEYYRSQLKDTKAALPVRHYLSLLS